MQIHLSKSVIILPSSSFSFALSAQQKASLYTAIAVFSLWSDILLKKAKWQLNTYFLNTHCDFTHVLCHKEKSEPLHPLRTGGIYDSLSSYLHIFPAPYKDIMLVIAGEYKNKKAGNLWYILIFRFCLSQSIKWIGQICWSAWKLTQKRNNEKKKKFSFESGSELLILQEFYPWSYIKSRASMPVNGKRKQEQSFWHYLLLSTDLGVCKLAKLEQTWPNNHNSVFLLQ